MGTKRRHEKIVVLVRAAGKLSVEELAAKLDVSKETIRRDLVKLDQLGQIKKFHGGARADIAPTNDVIAGSFAARMTEYRDEKRKLCIQAAKLLNEGDTLFINGGSTTVIFAEVIAGFPRLVVVTNSDIIAKIVGANPCHDVFLLGGRYQRDLNQNLGLLTIEQIEKFYAQYAVLTVGAVNSGVISDFDLQVTEVARAMIKRSEKTVVLADHSKFARHGTFGIANADDIDYLVTDRKPDHIANSGDNYFSGKLLCGS